MNDLAEKCVFRNLGLSTYEPVWRAMQQFTKERTSNDADEIWFVEHLSVFTQGLAGKQEHLLKPGDIPIVQVDRGGQVTYHGPGQLVVYFMIDLKRKKLGVRQLVTHIENIIIKLLARFKIEAVAKADAPGVYVDNKKICSLGLKIKRGCSFHGLALNINMDKEPFTRINPCGYQGLEMVQLKDLAGPSNIKTVEPTLRSIILDTLDYSYSEVQGAPELEYHL
ncbi:MAG: lipoyl(octanoyl) transferase LipB [Kangiellaceae bacterium]|nr:lipoyl(octanoyl) transferase LipB [Kangiellaceae bacterium]